MKKKKKKFFGHRAFVMHCLAFGISVLTVVYCSAFTNINPLMLHVHYCASIYGQ